MILAAWYIARKRKWNFYEIADLGCTAAPIGLGLGRIGNFINGELFGRPTNVPWAMVFPEGGTMPRHPSQLYEAILEGLVLFLILRWIYRKNLYPGTVFWRQHDLKKTVYPDALFGLSKDGRNAVYFFLEIEKSRPNHFQDGRSGLESMLHRYDEYPGTGVGLAIVHKAVERLGGSSGLESVPGAGSRFWIELPLAEDHG